MLAEIIPRVPTRAAVACGSSGIDSLYQPFTITGSVYLSPSTAGPDGTEIDAENVWQTVSGKLTKVAVSGPQPIVLPSPARTAPVQPPADEPCGRNITFGKPTANGLP